MLEIDDRVYDLELRANGIDRTKPSTHPCTFCPILRVTTELMRGKLQFVVDFLDNHAHHKNKNEEEVFTFGWQRLVFAKEDWEGVVGFVDGFMGSGGRTDHLELVRPGSGSESDLPKQVLCGWFFEKNPRDDRTRTLRFRSVVKALVGYSREDANLPGQVFRDE